MARHIQPDLTIAANGTVSTALEMRWHQFDGIFVPSGMTSCDLTMQVSNDGIHFGSVLDEYNTQVCVWKSTTGNFGVSTKALGAALGYSHIRFSCSVSQPNGVTFQVRMKDLFAGNSG
jgi:hypothetical protein